MTSFGMPLPPFGRDPYGSGPARKRISAPARHIAKVPSARFQPPLGGMLSLGKSNAFFLGGGRGMLNALYGRAAVLGATCVYDAPVKAAFRDDVKPLELYLAILAPNYFYVSNRHTLSAFLGVDLLGNNLKS
jgi:hypothetical protein